MTSLACDICFEDFSEVSRIPKMVDCGHTFCSVCLLNILQSLKSCPTCKASLNKSLEEYPTNFIVLQQSEETKESKYSISVRNLKDLENLLKLKSEMILRSIEERSYHQSLLNNDIARIRQMLQFDEYVFNITDADNLILDLEEGMEKIDLLLSCSCKSDLQPTYSLTTYNGSTLFLHDLTLRLLQGETIYVYEKNQGGIPNYGNISLKADRILKTNKMNIHALGLPKIDTKTSIVSMKDFRQCITADNFRTFIKIETKTLEFFITDSSFLALRFIKLCSGEERSKFAGNIYSVFEEVEEQEVEDEKQGAAEEEKEEEESFILSYLRHFGRRRGFGDRHIRGRGGRGEHGRCRGRGRGRGHVLHLGSGNQNHDLVAPHLDYGCSGYQSDRGLGLASHRSNQGHAGRHSIHSQAQDNFIGHQSLHFDFNRVSGPTLLIQCNNSNNWGFENPIKNESDLTEDNNSDDYDLSIFTSEKKDVCSKGEVIVQMFKGYCKIHKCVSEKSTYKNVVAKIKDGFDINFHNMSEGVIEDCGISLIL